MSLESWRNVFTNFTPPEVVEPAYPPIPLRYRAWELCSFEDTRCVILGQDPYHTPGAADGLAFSTQPSYSRTPPSLANIFHELKEDIGCKHPTTNSLEHWANNGVLLINSRLTVAPNRPRSHHHLTWWVLIRDTIKRLSNDAPPIVFLAWGKDAQEMVQLVDTDRHLVIRTSHPSPYSAHISFLGSHPFSRANEFLSQHERALIPWCLP